MVHKIDATEGTGFRPVDRVAFNDTGLLFNRKKQEEESEQAAVVASRAMPPINFQEAGSDKQLHNPSGSVFG